MQCSIVAGVYNWIGMRSDGTDIVAPVMPRVAIILHVCVCDQVVEEDEEHDKDWGPRRSRVIGQ